MYPEFFDKKNLVKGPDGKVEFKSSRMPSSNSNRMKVTYGGQKTVNPHDTRFKQTTKLIDTSDKEKASRNNSTF